MEGWVAKSVARQLATAVLWVRITTLKNHKWVTEAKEWPTHSSPPKNKKNSWSVQNTAHTASVFRLNKISSDSVRSQIGKSQFLIAFGVDQVT